MVAQTKDLWDLVKYRPHIDPDDLADAIQEQIRDESLDYRTRLLIRDSVEALQKYWGSDRFQMWLAHCPARDRIGSICQEQFERPGFPSRERRLMEKTDTEQICQFIRELGVKMRRTVLV